MKHTIYKGESYKVIAPNTSYGLDIGFVVTAEAAVARVRESQKRVVEKGYKAEKWLVVKTEWTHVFSKDGEFLREGEHTEVVAIVNADGTAEYKE